MRLLIAIGLRNIWRNPRRSFLTASVLAIALCSMMLLDSFVKPIRKQLIGSQTNTFMGHAQVHHPSYREEQEIEQKIEDIEKVRTFLRQHPQVKSFSERVISEATLSSAEEFSGVQVFAVNFAEEGKLSKIKKAVISGEYPKSENKRDIIIGQELAEKLAVQVGDKLVLTVNNVIEKEMQQKMFRVKAIFKSYLRSLDKYSAFVAQTELQEMLGLKDAIHQVAIKFNNIEFVEQQQDSIWQELKNENHLLESWPELLPALKSILELNDISIYIIAAIFFIFIFFTIINTLLMAIFERLFEFGVLKSIGSKPWQIALTILSESFALAVLGSLMGLILGSALIYYLSISGVTAYTDMEINGSQMNQPIYTQFTLQQFTLFPLSIIIMTLISGVYPAIYASRIKESDAMRKSL